MFKSKRLKAFDLGQIAITTLIGEEMAISGDIVGEDCVRIDGKVNGHICVEKGIVIGEKALIIGDLKSDHIIIYGQVQGNIQCKSLAVKATGIIQGEIHVHAFSVDMGARLNGPIFTTDPIPEDQRLIANT